MIYFLLKGPKPYIYIHPTYLWVYISLTNDISIGLSTSQRQRKNYKRVYLKFCAARKHLQEILQLTTSVVSNTKYYIRSERDISLFKPIKYNYAQDFLFNISQK